MDVSLPTESEYKVCCHIAQTFAKATGRLDEYQALLVILAGREKSTPPLEALGSIDFASLFAKLPAPTTEQAAGAIDTNAPASKPDDSWKQDDGKREADTIFLPFEKVK